MLLSVSMLFLFLSCQNLFACLKIFQEYNVKLIIKTKNGLYRIYTVFSYIFFYETSNFIIQIQLILQKFCAQKISINTYFLTEKVQRK